MIYVKYTVLAVMSLLITILAFVIAPLLPLFASTREGQLDNATQYGLGRRLPTWLNWFMTSDNSLEGDGGWKTEHWQWRFKLPNALALYVGEVGWLWRNPAYSFAMLDIDGTKTLESSGDNSIKDNDNAKEGKLFVKTQNVFQYVYVKRIGKTNRCFYVNLGWNIRALIDPNNKRNPYRATFVFSPRISGFRP